MDQLSVNGAGYMPYEDVPRNLYDEEESDDNTCLKCGGETVDRMVGDEIYEVCADCNVRV